MVAAAELRAALTIGSIFRLGEEGAQSS